MQPRPLQLHEASAMPGCFMNLLGQARQCDEIWCQGNTIEMAIGFMLEIDGR